MTASGRSGAGVLMVLTSAVCFSAKAILAKLAYRHGADATTVLTLRMAFALPFFTLGLFRIPWLARSRPAAELAPGEPRVRLREWLQLLALGSFGYYLASLFDFMGLTYVSAGLERLILFLYPTIVILLNVVFHRERISARLWQAVGLSYGGVGLVVYGDSLTGGSNVALGSGLVFLGAIAYAFYLSFSQSLIMRHGSTRVTSHILVVACCCALAQFALAGDYARLALPWQVYALCAATGLFATVLPAFLLTAGIKRLGASQASLIGTLGPVSTLLLAYWFLGEPITVLQVAGSGLVLMGVWRVAHRERTA
jgi:drug/metabolite transporter (DMT)-like permease